MATQLMMKNPDHIRQTALASLSDGQKLLNKSYLPMLGQFSPMLLRQSDKLSYGTDVRLFKVERIVLENKQSVLESLTAAYTALGSAGFSIFLLLKGNGKETDVYLGVRNEPKKMQGQEAGALLENVFKGHFSGSLLNFTKGDEVERLMFNLNQTQNHVSPSVTAITGVPSLAVDEREHFMQGLEKFIDAVEGKSYQALILAEPIGAQQLNLIQRGYENVATQLSPLLKQSLSFGQNESESVGLSIGESINQSFGTSLGLTETKSTNESQTITETSGTHKSHTETFGTHKSYTDTTSQSSTAPTMMSKVGMIGSSAIGAGLGFMLGGPIGMGLGGSLGGTFGSAFSRTESTSYSRSNTEGSSHSLANTDGSSHSLANAKQFGSSSSTSKNVGTTQTDSYGNTRTDSLTTNVGSSRQVTFEMVDKSVEQLLKQVDHQLERIAEARRFGAWHTAAYFISDSTYSSGSLASIFLGLMRGQDSNSENFALTTWNSDKSRMLLPWLANLTHPRLMSELSRNLGIPYLTPATLVSGKEMAIQLSLPRRSTSTVTVVESQSFGRSIQTTDTISGVEKASKSIHLGTIRHLWQDTKQAVDLDVQKLSSHIFVTGSTGSGKSNTVYQILDQLNKNDVKFMVIEPAKGEYKNVFGHREDVLVLGTNPTQAQLLKINPFKFPKGVHVLEHIDRLVEIFNVCWPMYAAMPAVLKDAMLEAYRASGWNLDLSYNIYSDELFPTFKDLLFQLENVINQSAFSQEVKSNYIGSLVTRVKSLTNGLNGQIFSSIEIENETLFDQNVIVDLSRIGSQETKSLIMGILVMRLSEYRMSSSGMNQALKHVTVLEEAHNILKRTSTEQSSEGANVVSKAVEMLSNAIAEMRTYGEGFIIADQSPSAVDISAIRNTNTKIVMRLPDEADRRLAGKASGLTDEQLDEIAKLPKGVAIIYQNDWLEPVLCKIHHFNGVEKAYCYTPSNHISIDRKVFNLHLARLLLTKVLPLPEKYDLALLKQGLEKFDIQTEIKIFVHRIIYELEKYGSSSLLEIQNYRKIATYLVSALELRSTTYTKLMNLNEIDNFESFSQDLSVLLTDKLERFSKDLAKSIEQSIVTAFSLEDPNREIVLLAWKKIQENIK